MRQSEIKHKFDEIVAFSEVGEFIDTPVKHYSTGMRMRLAFAVAAHLEPEILMIDEVLAVGDARFQKRCISKMQDIGQQGRTVLFVSHNLQAITRLCQRTLLLDEGKLIQDGPSHRVINTYFYGNEGTTAIREWQDPTKAPRGEVTRLRAVRVHSEDGQIADAIDIRQPVALEMEYEVLKGGYVLMPGFFLFNEEGVQIFSTLDQDPNWRRRPRPEGRYVSKAWIPGNFLAEGTLFVGVGIFAPLNQDFNRGIVPNAVAFQVVDTLDGDSARGDWTKELGGVVRPILKWETQVSFNGSAP
jgi:lipopolysaccharide transport system ATP-binding protein